MFSFKAWQNFTSEQMEEIHQKNLSQMSTESRRNYEWVLTADVFIDRRMEFHASYGLISHIWTVAKDGNVYEIWQQYDPADKEYKLTVGSPELKFRGHQLQFDLSL